MRRSSELIGAGYVPREVTCLVHEKDRGDGRLRLVGLNKANRGVCITTDFLSRVCFPGVVIIALIGCSLPLLATEDITDGLRRLGPVRSMKALRDEHVVKQVYDYSCGAGALATLLTYGLNDPVTEREVVEQLMELLPKDETELRKRMGFSLLDLQHLAERRGYKALGFRIAPEYLSKLNAPVIVFIQPRDNKHFAVLKGVRADRVYLADPSLGNVRMPAYQFLDTWLEENGKGIVFVIEPKAGAWPQSYPLQLKPIGRPQPEIFRARQMLEGSSPNMEILQLAGLTPLALLSATQLRAVGGPFMQIPATVAARQPEILHVRQMLERGSPNMEILQLAGLTQPAILGAQAALGRHNPLSPIPVTVYLPQPAILHAK